MGHWFLEIEKKAEDGILHCKEHLDEHNEEPPSIITGSCMWSRVSQLSEHKTHQLAKRAPKLYRKAKLVAFKKQASKRKKNLRDVKTKKGQSKNCRKRAEMSRTIWRIRTWQLSVPTTKGRKEAPTRVPRHYSSTWTREGAQWKRVKGFKWFKGAVSWLTTKFCPMKNARGARREMQIEQFRGPKAHDNPIDRNAK